MSQHITLATRCKVLRTMVGLNQQQLAQQSSVQQSFISRLEAGNVANPGAMDMVALAEVFGCALEVLFGNDDVFVDFLTCRRSPQQSEKMTRSIDELLADDNVTAIFADDYTTLNYVVDGHTVMVPSTFVSEAELQTFLTQYLPSLSASNPCENGVLSNGHRIVGLVPPIVQQTSFAIQKKQITSFAIPNAFGSQECLDDLVKWAKKDANILISGTTGSGKTTLVNFLGNTVAQPNDRTFVIEDTPELTIDNSKQLNNNGRNKNQEPFSISDLIKWSLRMKPSRIVVGEVRGPEAFDMLDMMNTGHSGCMTTLHASSITDAMIRYEALSSGHNNVPQYAIKQLFAMDFDIIVHVAQRPDTKERLIVEVAQVLFTEDMTPYLHVLYCMDTKTDTLVKRAPLLKKRM